ncbi:hypothetical protein R1flu_020935 [Riccia fluitans]|uniref:Uncharacterized protein n=1 Tax=Riccia fluitans TaxID=41844 RepID=A0ABD1ZP41_9MARC
MVLYISNNLPMHYSSDNAPYGYGVVNEAHLHLHTTVALFTVATDRRRLTTEFFKSKKFSLGGSPLFPRTYSVQVISRARSVVTAVCSKPERRAAEHSTKGNAGKSQTRGVNQVKRSRNGMSGEMKRGGGESEGFSSSEVGSLGAGTRNVMCTHFSSDGRLYSNAGRDKTKVMLRFERFTRTTLFEPNSVIITEFCRNSTLPSPHSSKLFDDQDVSKLVSDHNRSSSDVVAQWQQSEAKLKNLNDKLTLAITEITAKDSLVKQHAKVAEEAVTGWEKAEAEAATLKQQLDLTLQQKLATEDRVSHLDGALKECMKQLRHVREEQEQRIHETMVKKTREYDKLRQEMEAKLADYSQHLQEARAEALESRGEARAVSNVLQEKTKALSDMSEAKARAEAEVKVLQVRLESLEKENGSLKYELHVLNKELEIRNDEREYERKATENASKQHLENVKKIAKLEAECQRLRILVRKKLPGPAALAQMKQEVDALGGSKDYEGKRRRSLGRSNTSRDSDSGVDSLYDPFQESTNREAEVLAERLVAMDDELKLVKEALAKREVELQAARLMCAKTATKLSHAEEQLEIARSAGGKGNTNTRSSSHKKEGSHSLGFKDGSENSTEAWEAASALIAELDQFKKSSDKQSTSTKLDLMDDFAEMERLAMASETENSEKKPEVDSKETKENSIHESDEYIKKLTLKERELEAANRLCLELKQKLSTAEKHLASVQSRNAANETAIISLQDKLDKLSENHQRDEGINKALEDLVEAQSMSMRNGAADESALFDEVGSYNGGRASNGGKGSTISRTSSEVGYGANDDVASVLSDAESKASTMGSDLLTTVRRVVRAVEVLAQATGSEHEISNKSRNSTSLDRSVQDHEVHPFIHWKNVELDGNMQGLILKSNKLLQGKADMVDFLGELTAVLNFLVNVCTRNVDQLVERIQCQADGVTSRDKDDEEFKKVRSEKAALESHMRAEMSRLIALEAELENTKKEKGELQLSLDAANQKLDAAVSQLREAEKLTSEVNGSHEHIESELRELATSKAELEQEVTMLHKKVASLEGELQIERRRYQGVVAKDHDYQQQLHSDSSAGSISRDGEWRHQSVDESELRLRKEREISSAAEKLAECQRSILDLGKQLKALSSSPRDSTDASYESDTASSIDRVTINGDHHRTTQFPPEENPSENHTASELHERSGSGRSRDDSSTPWSTPRANSITGSPFIDRRRSPSPSPPQVSRVATTNGHHYPGSSFSGRATSGEFRRGEANGYHHSGNMGSVTPNHQYGSSMGTAAASDFPNLGSISVPASPARSSSGLPFRPRGTSPMRSEFYHSSSSGNGTKEGDSESTTTSFSRFYARTKSSNIA